MAKAPPSLIFETLPQPPLMDHLLHTILWIFINWCRKFQTGLPDPVQWQQKVSTCLFWTFMLSPVDASGSECVMQDSPGSSTLNGHLATPHVRVMQLEWYSAWRINMGQVNGEATHLWSVGHRQYVMPVTYLGHLLAKSCSRTTIALVLMRSNYIIQRKYWTLISLWKSQRMCPNLNQPCLNTLGKYCLLSRGYPALALIPVFAHMVTANIGLALAIQEWLLGLWPTKSLCTMWDQNDQCYKSSHLQVKVGITLI